MATLNCTVVGQQYNGTINSAYSTTASSYAGFNYNNAYYLYRLKFTTPSFIGPSVGLTFNIMWGTRPNVNNVKASEFSLRWALLTSDNQLSSYANTKNEVTNNADRLAVGRVDFTGLTKDDVVTSLTVPTTELVPNTDYYLYFWGDGSTNKQQNFCTAAHSPNHSVVLEYTPFYYANVYHYLRTDDGGLSQFHYESGVPIDLGASWTPVAVTPPETHTVEDATFNAWTRDWATKVGGGAVGIDYITVNCDIVVEVYYEQAGAHFYVNVNGAAVKQPVILNVNGAEVLCDVFVNINGEAVKC